MRKSAISPVIGVILLIVLVIGISASASYFAFNITQTDTTHNTDFSFTFKNNGTGVVKAEILQGSPDRVLIIVNGTVEKNVTSVSPGQTIIVRGVNESARVSLVANEQVYRTIEVKNGAVDPVAKFNYTPEEQGVGDSVSFDGSESIASDSASFSWEFGDGSTASGKNVSHTYGSSGNYSVKLTVTESNGDTSTRTKEVTIRDYSTSPNCNNVEYEEGSGTSGDPYEINTVYELQCMNNYSSGTYFELSSDVDASDTTGWNSGKGFNPVTSQVTLYGSGYTVNELNINRPTELNVALFSNNDKTIKNLRLSDVSINGKANVGAVVGVLQGAGSPNPGLIKNVSVTGTINQTSSPGQGGTVGGIAGRVDITTKVVNSYSTARVYADTVVAGGLVGDNRGTIKRSYATGDVTADGNNAGGLVAENSGTIRNSYSVGKVEVVTPTSNPRIVGGLVASNSGTVTDSYWDTQTSGQSGSDGGTGLTTTEMQGSSASSNMDFDFTNFWDTVTNPDDYPVLKSFNETTQLNDR